MRLGWILIVLMIASAQAAVIDDGSGDVGVTVADQRAVDVPAGVRDGIDVVSLEIEEDAATITFILTMVAATSPGDDAAADRTIWIRFAHDGQRFAILHETNFAGKSSAWLYALADQGPSEIVQELEPALVDATYSFVIPRASLVGVHGAPPAMGSVLTDVSVEASQPYIVNLITTIPMGGRGQTRNILIHDDAGPVDYPIRFGATQSGDARLASDIPFRVSNGEASTFVYWVNGTNIGDSVATFRLALHDVPKGWAVEIPTAPFEIEKKKKVPIPVVVRTPSGHVHGGTDGFRLEMTSNRTGDLGALELGVIYPTIPQPSGHHPTLWLGSRSNGDALHETAVAPGHNLVFGNGGHEVPYLRALEDDGASLDVPVDFRGCSKTISSALSYRCLVADLEPGLAMGLDFDLEKVGQINLQIGSLVPLSDATLEGQLQHVVTVPGEGPVGAAFPDEDIIVLADFGTDGPFDLDAQGVETLDLEITPKEAADLVPYDPDAGLRLVLFLNHTGPSADYIMAEDAHPQLLPGARMDLPLIEYRDPVGSIPDLGSALYLATDRIERAANPGDAIRFTYTLENGGPQDRFLIRVIGAQAEWARLSDAGPILIPEGGSGQFHVDVHLPHDAPLGPIDLVVEAASSSDALHRAVSQVRIQIVEDPVDDDLELILQDDGKDKKSPSIGVLFGTGLLALAFRRR